MNNFGPKVPWCKIVWFSNNIPRNSFILWMAILEKLKTQDRVISWGINGNLLCPFCNLVCDSHNHLFFICEFSSRIWNFFYSKIGIWIDFDNWNDLVHKFCSVTKRKTLVAMVRKLVLAACVAHIWRKRNARIFRKLERPWQEVRSCIEQEIKYKLKGLEVIDNVVNKEVFKK